MFFVEASMLFIVLHHKRLSNFKLVLAGVFLGLAILTKWLPALIVLPCFFILNIGNLKSLKLYSQMLLVILVAGAIVLPWQLYINYVFPLESMVETQHRIRHFFEVLDSQGGGVFFHFVKATAVVHEFIWVAFLFSFLLSLKVGSKRILFLLIWIIVPYIFFSFSKTKMQAYLLFCTPAAFLILAYFYHNFLTQILLKRTFKIIILIAFFFLPIRYSIERTKVFHKRDRNPKWVSKLKKLNELPENTIVFNEPRYIEAMFYSDKTVYGMMPSEKIIDSLTSIGYNVIIR